eukprot:250432-Rhodomonas_salina.2
MQSYKDHPVPELKGDPVDDDETIFRRPTLAQYEKWLHTVCKVLGAISILWLVPMVLGLEFERGEYIPIVPGNDNNPDDPLFQYVVVAMAIAEGTLQHLPETENELFNRVNSTFLNVFGFINVHAKQHPLAGLRELSDIHSVYQCNGASVNSATSWRATFLAIHKKVEQDTQSLSITDWINGPELNEAISWSELFDNIHSFLASDSRQEEQDSANDSGVGKKRKAPSGVSAPVYYTIDEAMSKIAAFFSVSGHSAPSRPASGGGGLKKQPVCLNPACKVHHPGGLQSCQLSTMSRQRRSSVRRPGVQINETQDNLDDVIQHKIKSFRLLPPSPVNFDIVGTLMCLAHITCGVSASIIATITCILGVARHYLALPAEWSAVRLLLYITSIVGQLILLWLIAVLLVDSFVPHLRFRLVYKLKHRVSVQLAHIRANTMTRRWQAMEQCNFAAAHLATACVSPHILMVSADTMRTSMFVDTGCAISIVNSQKHLVNVLRVRIHPIRVQGVAGTRDNTFAGDATSNYCTARLIIVNNVLLDEEFPVNLLSADQLLECGFSVRIKPSDKDCCLVLNPQ